MRQHLNEAVDKVRRQENKALKAAGYRRLAGTKFNWLVNEAFAEQFNALKQADLKVLRAWAIRCRLGPSKEKARMLKNHLLHILTYFKHQISNAVAEELNSKIQTVKANAKGYRAFDGFRNSILFHCGGLDMTPRGYTILRRTHFFECVVNREAGARMRRRISGVEIVNINEKLLIFNKAVGCESPLLF